MTTLEGLLEGRRILFCVGSGGVGKTTTAAALAVGAARRGRRTAVLTVDPAPRLKDALGLGTLDARPRRVPLGAGVHLDAVLLDVRRTFDEVVRGLAATPEQARAVLENRLYQNLSGTLAGTAEYTAVETVFRLAQDGGYDLLVVDTPPARHVVDFLDAPRRLLALLDSRAFAILKDPTVILPGAGSRVAHYVLSAVLRGLERFTGLELVREVGDFVRAIEALTGSLHARVEAADALLHAADTALVLVTAPEPRLVEENARLAQALAGLRLPVGGIIVNRMLPRALLAPAGPLPDGLAAPLMVRLRRAHGELAALAARQEAVLAPLVARAGAPVVAEVPLLAGDLGGLDDVTTIARHLFPPAATGSPSVGRLGG